MARDSMLINEEKDIILKKSLILDYENKYLNYFDKIQTKLDH